ncbi:hypothetical protein MQA28_25720, partial [Escherichia coli]|nr:hypothetical protein [Escherichia coli]
ASPLSDRYCRRHFSALHWAETAMRVFIILVLVAFSQAAGTFDVLKNAFGDFVETQGDNLLKNVVPELVKTIFPENPDINEVHAFVINLKNIVTEAVQQAKALDSRIRNLALGLLLGKVTPDQLQTEIPRLKERAHTILVTLRHDLEAQVAARDNKRQLLELWGHVLDSVVTQGAAVVDQATDVLDALLNPANLLSVAGDVLIG